MNKSIITLLVLLCIFHTVASNDGKIFGGFYADEGQFPFMVQLYHKGQDSLFCGGSLIGPYHVLTAAHCTEGLKATQIQVWGGSVYIYSSDSVYIDVQTIYEHPNYNTNLITNDVAVIKLKKPFPITAGLRTIKLASSLVSSGTSVKVAGWGKAEYGYYPYYLLYTTVPVITTTKCRSYRDYEDVSATNQICCFKAGSDSCQGDSGGPLFTGSGATAVQHGIVSWGIGCAVKPGVYAAVSAYRNWIITKATHTVSTTCNGCSTNTVFKNMCQSISGTYRLTSSSHQCQNLNPDKTRKINYSWSGCSNTILKDFCTKVGRFSCVNGRGKCTAL